MKKLLFLTAFLLSCITTPMYLFAQEKYGNSILSLSPFAASNESGFGFGIRYEHMLDKTHNMSFVLPINFIVVNKTDYSLNNPQTTIKYFYPGVRFYPATSNNKVSYSIGLSCAIGFGKIEANVYDTNSGGTITRTINGSRGGIILCNGLNFRPTTLLYIGMEAGIGAEAFNNFDNQLTYKGDPILQFQAHLGFRF